MGLNSWMRTDVKYDVNKELLSEYLNKMFGKIALMNFNDYTHKNACNLHKKLCICQQSTATRLVGLSTIYALLLLKITYDSLNGDFSLVCWVVILNVCRQVQQHDTATEWV